MNHFPDTAAAGVFPLTFTPRLKSLVWGGRKLESQLGKSLPTSDLYAESWELSPLPGDVSVVDNAVWSGTTLAEFWSRYPMWRGPQLQSAEQFPWLIKWLDCQDRLSVQVHPDTEISRRLTGKAQPKSEVWVVVQADPSARIWAGCRPGVTPEMLAAHMDAGTVVECLHEFTPQVGDCIHLPAGTVHAAGGGLLVAEVQQPSDVTFRLFDWNRVGVDGQPRELHREAGLAALHWPQPPVVPVTPQLRPESRAGLRGERLLSAAEFQLDRWTLSLPWTRKADEFAVWMVLGGHGRLLTNGEVQPVSAGQTFWFPAVPLHTTWQPDDNGPLVLLQVTPPVV